MHGVLHVPSMLVKTFGVAVRVVIRATCKVVKLFIYELNDPGGADELPLSAEPLVVEH